MVSCNESLGEIEIRQEKFTVLAVFLLQTIIILTIIDWKISINSMIGLSTFQYIDNYILYTQWFNGDLGRLNQ